MACEQTSGFTQELYRQFDGMRPVLLIAADREANGFDTPYDHFMYNYVGHPIRATLPEMITQHPEFGVINYDTLRLASYTQSHQLVLVREDQRLPGNEPARYAVVTADLREKTITHWYVADTRFSQSYEGLKLQLLLSDRPLAIVNEATNVPEGIDPDKAVLVAWEREEQHTGHTGPSIILTSQGCWFVRTIGKPEPLGNIAQIHYGLEKYANIRQTTLGIAAIAPIIAITPTNDSLEISREVAKPARIPA